MVTTLFTVKVAVPSGLTTVLMNARPGSEGAKVAVWIACGAPFNVTDTICGLAVPGEDSVKETGLGLTTRPLPETPPPTLRLTWKLTAPDNVFTVTVPV